MRLRHMIDIPVSEREKETHTPTPSDDCVLESDESREFQLYASKLNQWPLCLSNSRFGPNHANSPPSPIVIILTRRVGSLQSPAPCAIFEPFFASPHHPQAASIYLARCANIGPLLG
jgi:hypothetical protein